MQKFACLKCGNVQEINSEEEHSVRCIKCNHETKDVRSMVRLDSSKEFLKNWKPVEYKD